MMKTFAMIGVGLVLLALPACGERVSEGRDPGQSGDTAAESSSGQPKAVAVAPDFDFGEVQEGENVEHVFKIRNEGTADLAILSAKGS